MSAIDKPGVLSALREIRAEAKYLESAERYQHVSVRMLAEQLGHDELIDDILAACVEGGFDYCLDPSIPTRSHPDFELKHPPSFACMWGADQLRSRLDCIDYRVYSPHYEGD